MAGMTAQRELEDVSSAWGIGHIPEHKLAVNQRPTRENQDLYNAAAECVHRIRGPITKILAAGI